MTQPWAWAEMSGAAVWDRRCIRSLVRICEYRERTPLVSFSVACGNAVRQAATRIFHHASSTVDGLLRGHFEETHRRCTRFLEEQPEMRLLVVQDTTTMDYTSHPATTGLGPINSGGHTRGLLVHAALAVPPEGPPLGLTHLSIWARDPETHGKSRDPNDCTDLPIELKESQKWLDGLWSTEATLPGVPLLLIGDREADMFELFAAARQPTTELLVRAHHPRRVRVTQATDSQQHQKLPAVLAAASCLGSMEITVPRAPRRPERQATLALRSVAVWLLPPNTPHVRELAPVRVWVIEAREVDTTVPEPIHWILVSTQPVPDAATASQMVRYYTRRWVIEELHLVLKSGLRVERLQMQDAHSLSNALAIHYVTAWRILHLRDAARRTPEGPAERAVQPDEHALLEAVEGKALPTIRDVTRAIAHLAGFPRYPSAGEPGVRSLCAGLYRLAAMVEAWNLAKRHT
jgi:hypothetical protein